MPPLGDIVRRGGEAERWLLKGSEKYDFGVATSSILNVDVAPL